MIQYSSESNYTFAQATGEAKHPRVAFAQAKMLFNLAKSLLPGLLPEQKYCLGYCPSKHIAGATAWAIPLSKFGACAVDLRSF